MDFSIKSSRRVEFLILILILILALILRIGVFQDGEYIIGPHDTFAPAAGALEVISGDGYNYRYLSSPGSSLLLIPFLLISKSFLSIQIALLFYSIFSILIIYILIRKVYPSNSFPALISCVFIAVNPTLVIYSIILFYDMFQILGLLVFILSIVYLSERFTAPNVFLYVISGILLFLLKESNIVFILLSGVFFLFINKKKSKIKISKEFCIFLILFIFLIGGYFINPLTNDRASRDVPNFFHIENIENNLLSTMPYLLHPFSSPNFSGIFKYTTKDFGNLTFVEPLLVLGLLLVAIVYLIKERVELSLLLFGSIAVNIAFFSLFLKWQLRYYFPSLIMIFVLLAFGFYFLVNGKFREQYRVIISFVVILIFVLIIQSIIQSVQGVQDINSHKGQINNYLLLNNSDMDVLGELDEGGIIYSSYGPWVNFYINLENYELENYDVYEVFYYTNDSIPADLEIIRSIKSNLDMGKPVYYLAGWQELFITNRDETRNYALFWKSLGDELILKEIYFGDNKICQELLNYNCFKIYEVNLKDDTEN